MKTVENIWTQEELKAYILIYCANANYEESTEEIEFINSKIPEADFKKMHKEFDHDNDYQSLQKINAHLEHFKYTNDQKEGLFDEIKALFLSDEKYDTLERNLLRGLQQLLS